MSRKGCSPDNAACEGFFGHLKNEMFYNRSWEGCSIAELKYEIDSYIRWYCTDRIKSTLGGLSPLQYRKELGVAVKKMSVPPLLFIQLFNLILQSTFDKSIDICAIIKCSILI